MPSLSYLATRSTPAPELAGTILGTVEQSALDPISTGSSPAPKSCPHPSTELVGHQDVSCVNVPGSLSPIPHPGLGPSECQQPFSVDQIPSGEIIIWT